MKLPGWLSGGRVFDVALVAGDLFLGGYIADILRPYVWTETPHWGRVMPPHALALICLAAAAAYVSGLILYLPNIRRSGRESVDVMDHAANAFLSVMFGTIFGIVASSFVPAEGETLIMWVMMFCFFIAGGAWFVLHQIALMAAAKDRDAAQSASVKRSVLSLALMYPFIIGLFTPVNLTAQEMYLALDANPPEGFFHTAAAIVMRAGLMALWAWIVAYLPRKIAGIPLKSQFRSSTFFLGMFLAYLCMFLKDLLF